MISKLQKNSADLSEKFTNVFADMFTGSDAYPFTAKKNSLYSHSFDIEAPTYRTATLRVSITTSKDIKDAYNKLAYKLKEYKDKVLGTRYSRLTESEQKYLQERLLIGFNLCRSVSMFYDVDTNKHTITISYKWAW